MKLLDRIAINRLVSILTSFILQIIKIFKTTEPVDDITPKPPRKLPFFRRRKKL
jgi:hypothetical protein